jgi:ABC-2 type transport system ATP-binding protein
MIDLVVQVKGLRKRYGSFVAVDGIDFEIARGEIFGLLGPNGAGKTSTLECMEGLRAPDGGQIDILGIDPVREPRRLTNVIGVQLQSSGLPESISVGEAMRLFCAYHGVPPREDLLRRLGLAEKLSAQFHTLSTGQQRRLTLALAVAHNPPVVFLDEPTAGLDVGSRNELHALMRELRAAGTTFLLATHDMAEAEKMAGRIAILLRGRIVATGTPRELTAAGAGLTRVSVRTERGSLLAGGLAFPEVEQQVLGEEYAVYYSRRPGPTVGAILAHVDARGDELIDLRVERPSLEERFLELTAGGPR